MTNITIPVEISMIHGNNNCDIPNPDGLLGGLAPKTAPCGFVDLPRKVVPPKLG